MEELENNKIRGLECCSLSLAKEIELFGLGGKKRQWHMKEHDSSVQGLGQCRASCTERFFSFSGI